MHLGTNVRSGTLRCVVVATGEATQFGAIAQRLTSAMLAIAFAVFVPVPGTLIAALLAITVLYVVAAEVTKRRFYRAAHRTDAASA